jgi:hypothetical protein
MSVGEWFNLVPLNNFFVKKQNYLIYYPLLLHLLFQYHLLFQDVLKTMLSIDRVILLDIILGIVFLFSMVMQTPKGGKYENI